MIESEEAEICQTRSDGANSPHKRGRRHCELNGTESSAARLACACASRAALAGSGAPDRPGHADPGPAAIPGRLTRQTRPATTPRDLAVSDPRDRRRSRLAFISSSARHGLRPGSFNFHAPPSCRRRAAARARGRGSWRARGCFCAGGTIWILASAHQAQRVGAVALMAGITGSRSALRRWDHARSLARRNAIRDGSDVSDTFRTYPRPTPRRPRRFC